MLAEEQGAAVPLAVDTRSSIRTVEMLCTLCRLGIIGTHEDILFSSLRGRISR